MEPCQFYSYRVGGLLTWHRQDEKRESSGSETKCVHLLKAIALKKHGM
jgi:hypothetical protein